jgi:hypothetical protein
MLSLRTHALICLGFLAALIAVAAGGNALAASGMIKDPAAIRLPGLILIFGLFLAFGFSAVPVMVLSVLRPRGGGPPDKGMAAAQKVITWAMWALMAAGLVIALPAMVKDGFFSPGGPGAANVSPPAPP